MSKHKRDKSSNSNRRTFLKVSGVMTDGNYRHEGPGKGTDSFVMDSAAD